jgi:Polyketide cyclase / dehydrase and lipid transport
MLGMSRQRIEHRATTTADPSTVYALLRNGATWPTWAPIDSFELEKPGADEREGIGAVRLLRGGRVTGHDEIVELVPDRRFAYRHTSNLPVSDYLGEVDLEPTSTGTAIRWISTFKPKIPGTGRLLRRGLDDFVARLVSGLAEHAAAVESGRTASPSR